jgi:hypothetical protein
MSLIEYDILKEKLMSMNIEERFIEKMIRKSNSFTNELKNNSISYTFPLYTSFKKIDEMFSVGGVPEKLVEKIKPVSLNVTLSKIFHIKKLTMTYRYFEETYILLLDYHNKSGSLVKVDKTSQKRSINATHALDQLYSNFGIDKDVCEMIKKNQFINGEYGHFNVSLYDNKFTIKSDFPVDACNVPTNVFRIFGKKPVFLTFEFNNDYICNIVSFIDKKVEIINNAIHITHVTINMDITGNLISYIKATNQTNPHGEDLVVKFFDLKVADLSIEEIEAYIRIYNEPSLFEEIVPEFFINGPSNIPNFSERFILAQMIAC